MLGVSTAPVIGRVIDRLFPWFATAIASVASLIFYAIQTGAGGVNIAAVVIVCFGIDIFRQTQQVSLATSVFGLDPSARSRMNAVLIISIFFGQIIGTSVGTSVFNSHGWRPAAALSVGWQGFSVLMLLLRGPHCSRYTWFGYEGGFEMWKKKPQVSPETNSGEEKIKIERGTEGQQSTENEKTANDDTSRAQVLNQDYGVEKDNSRVEGSERI
ncbi:hypothetical protein PHLCEN_2v7154 [Hermanssonia centrifuga]|uniref:Major facilitator superfamily (MFS) profile domain-containing protein n=1 Tax=Hermanssonia centrifuga TaxID=98765 RepID=A0A2R6NXK2_9APHY|nr:hypothetical protein PHLCEN_2v7154 [Hermanssonia centrifuga]